MNDLSIPKEQNVSETSEEEQKITAQSESESNQDGGPDDFFEPPDMTPEQKRKEVVHELLSWLKAIVIGVAAAVFLSLFVIVNATVPTGSMENTIMPGDRLIGFRLSYVFSEPERGDIIIFKYPDDPSKKYIKRIIGMPGETVTIVSGRVYINDSTEPLADTYVKEETYGDYGPYVVPEDSYFMMGDNRNNSNDSRYWTNTFVEKDAILGKAIFRYYPGIKGL